MITQDTEFEKWAGNSLARQQMALAFRAGRLIQREKDAEICTQHAADCSFLTGRYAEGCESEALSCAAAIREQEI